MVIELQKAKEEIVRWVQRTSFPDVYRALANMFPGSSEQQVKKVLERILDFQVESEVKK